MGIKKYFGCGSLLKFFFIEKKAAKNTWIGQVAVTFNARIGYVIDQVFSGPTWVEGYIHKQLQNPIFEVVCVYTFKHRK